MTAKVGKVYLVGAGPGDPKLITLKGMECIRKADVIVYDRLINQRLLNYARPDAELIYAGKSPESHTLKQKEINQVLVEKARENKVVVRLKGGDPFLFGRGGEEAVALREAGIPYEVVPGITSAIAVPAYAGIPVTHRNYTSSFAVITGNEDPLKGEGTIAWDKIATGAGTLVFLMGMRNLPHIVEQLVENGLAPDTPIALIQWGTRPEQRTVIGTLADIVDKSREAGLKHPVTIVVGKVAGLREQLAWYEDKPLFGKRIVVTRTREQAGALAEKIEELGGEAWEFPVIKIVPPEDYGPLDRAIEELEKYSWIIFTSVNGVRFFFARLRHHRRDIRALAGIKLCAIGPKTQEALEQYGFIVDYVPQEYRAEAIIEGLKQYGLEGRHVLLPRADIARKILPEALQQMGVLVDEVVAYRTVKGSGDVKALKNMLERGTVHAVSFTSSSTVRYFMELLGEEAASLLKGVTVACIGPITAGTARELGLQVDVEAQEYTIDGLVEALVEYFQGRDNA
ncbi:uroporphyrinogen-III C-methyltransferase [Calderihabitans maritimus]|uniref:uroporphyrinogen-III C-methyltransferase n=1 Tax=Calderihabitans maritimus TaxID=1246530 RepID=A0A1Z5HVN0_9FIRM|nr:uroporphyrinogen-III C-methyltransferase [Calderihabitans maritimus]GAW93603.1 uroporphyrin-III C-methyltransferase [Calderihabitans maritimus]